eukprot:6612669-Karenia_brevis.AAC.1
MRMTKTYHEGVPSPLNPIGPATKSRLLVVPVMVTVMMDVKSGGMGGEQGVAGRGSSQQIGL